MVGLNQIAQFASYSYFSWGFFLPLVAGLLVALVIIADRRRTAPRLARVAGGVRLMLAPLPLPAPLIALALAVAGVEGAVTPAARLVTSTSSRGYETVTEALAAARPGDTVRLARGVHGGRWC